VTLRLIRGSTRPVYGAAGVLARRHPLLELVNASSFAAAGAASASTGGDARRSMVPPYAVERHQPSGSAMISASCALET
jgi:hypothetical protein